jgi:hypothetical protein
MYIALTSAVVSSIIFIYYPVPILVTMITIFGYTLSVTVVGSLFFIYKAADKLPGTIFSKIRRRLNVDKVSYTLIQEVCMLSAVQFITLMLGMSVLLIVFLGVGSFLTARKLLVYLNKEYEVDFEEALKQLPKRK